MGDLSRRAWLKAGIVGSLAAAIGGASDSLAAIAPTPPEIEGPFYPVVAQKDKDFDLTRVEGHEESAEGRVIFIQGQIVDTEDQPIEDATVDLWQANAAGRYRHPHDPNPAPLDPNFQGWAIVPSGERGAFRFKTIFPGAYPAGRDWMRPPHIHFKVSKRGYVELITQMYFPGHELNEKDLLIRRKRPEQRKLMIAKQTAEDPETYDYRIVLQKA